MKSIQEFLADLRNLDIKVWVDGNRLRCNAPKGVMTLELKTEIGDRKTEIIQWLQSQSIQQISRTNTLPLSFSQQRLWFLTQLEEANAIYNESAALKLEGKLNQEALEASWREIVKRQEILRTTFETVNGEPRLVIDADLYVNLDIIDLQKVPETQQLAKVKELAAQEIELPFDLSQGPLWRVSLFKLAEDCHILLVVMHHIICDGWSFGILIQELSALYYAFCAGVPSPLPDLSIQYVDFAHWQRQHLQGEVLDNQLGYWQQKLADLPALLELPLDHSRPVVQTYRGSSETFALSPELTTRLQGLSQQSGGTLFMTLLAAFGILLSRYSGQEDIAIGSPIANRNRQEVEPLIGFFVNTLVLRLDLGDNPSFIDLLKGVQTTCLEAYAHQDVPFEKLVEVLQPERNLSHTPLFQVMFVLQNAPMGDLALPELTLSPFDLEAVTAKFDLTLMLWEANGELRGTWEYNRDLFEPETIHRAIAHFQTLLEGIVANPQQPIAQLPLLTEAEKQQLLVEWNQTETDYPHDKCIHQLFEEQVEQTPEAIAVIFEDQQLTYRELNEKANQLAHYLQGLGVEPETLIGVCLERSLEMVISILGILKAGGAYLPVAPSSPLERLREIFLEAKPKVILSQNKWLGLFSNSSVPIIYLDTDWPKIAQENQENLFCVGSIDHLAYVCYTSGSTGKPKGVSVVHRGVVRLVRDTDYMTFNRAQTFLQLAPLAFDASTFEIWGPLLNGGRLVVFSSHNPSLTELGKAINDHQITTLWLTAGLFHLMVDEQLEALQSLHQLLAGGDVLSVPHVQKCLQTFKHCQLINGYGPTENTTFTCCYSITDINLKNASIPIGRPIANTQVYILDPYLNPTPIGVSGELYIGGDGLAKGYLNRPDLTQEKFIPNPFNHTSHSYLYKTGDLARYRPDGNIEFLGRIDNQVKIRGFRIELGEIEAVLTQHLGVKESVVMVKEENPGNKSLVAYVVSQQGQLSPSDLRNFLKEKLPDYMIPSVFMQIEAMPLNLNGKIDRKALPTPDREKDFATTFIAPRNPLEQKLARIWSESLGIHPVGVQDNFFTLGGHSLLALRMMAQIQQQFGSHLPLATLFQNPTIERLATLLEQPTDEETWSPLVKIQPKGSKSPFFCVPGAGGNVIYFYDLARYLDTDRPFYALQALGLDGKSKPQTKVEEMAAYYIEAIKTVQPQGPYLLGGHSFGGQVAFEIAQQLQKQGDKVDLVVILDSPAPLPRQKSLSLAWDDPRWLLLLSEVIESWLGKSLEVSDREIQSLTPEQQLSYFQKCLQKANLLPPESNLQPVRGLINVFKANHQTLYISQNAYPTTIAFFQASEGYKDSIVSEEFTEIVQDSTWGWSRFSAGVPKIYKVPGDHMTMMAKPHVQILGEQLRACLDEAQSNEQYQ